MVVEMGLGRGWTGFRTGLVEGGVGLGFGVWFFWVGKMLGILLVFVLDLGHNGDFWDNPMLAVRKYDTCGVTDGGCNLEVLECPQNK